MFVAIRAKFCNHVRGRRSCRWVGRPAPASVTG